MFLKLQVKGMEFARRMKDEFCGLLQDQKGEMVGTIGWMAIITALLVLVHGLFTGWLPNFINNIFSRMETLL